MMTTNTHLSEANLVAQALTYAGRGWRVLPVNGKVPLLKDWPTLATTDRPTIREWWTQHPDANVGIATGYLSGLFVLDVDPVHGGDDTLCALEAQHGALPGTIEVITGSGGRHYYFQHPGNYIRNSAGSLGPGLDIRGDGGQVVAPPSIHLTTGRAYEWEVAHHPDDVALASAPQWLLNKLTAKSNRHILPKSGETIPNGQRNVALTSEAGKLRRMGLSETELEAALSAMNQGRCTPPLPDEEVLDIATSVARYPTGQTQGVPFTGPAATTTAPHLTDVGNGQLFAQQHRASIRYCYPLRSWLVCDEESLWRSCPGNLVMQLAKASIVSLYDEAKRETHDERRTKLAAHAVKSENAQRLQAMIDLARSEPGISISPTAFDADPWLFSVANGVLDLKTGSFRERQRADLITKCSPVVFDALATCPTWLRFLASIFRDDHNMIAYIQQVTGYCLTGLTAEQVFFLLWGSGSNGKSTLLKVLLGLLGDYGLQTPADTFLSRTQDGRATPDLARLQGSRLAVAIESDEGCRLAEGTIKQMTGGDKITARRLYQDFIEFDPTHKILFATNHKPRVKDNTHAMWRRMRLIPFDVQIKDEAQDPALANKLLAELPGILNWALSGCLAWQQAGRLTTPEAVVTATASYRTEQDVLDDFLRERCVCGTEEIIKFDELRKDYAEWAEGVSERPLSSKAFAAALQDREFRPMFRKNARHYAGLRLRTINDDLTDAQASAAAES